MGYQQFGLAETSRQVYLLADLVICIIIVYLLIRPFNTKRGIIYLFVLTLAGLILSITAYLTLPSVHILSQLLIIMLVVGLPLYFEDVWIDLFSFEGTETKKFLGRIPRVIISIVLALSLVAIGNGILTKTSEIPQGVSIDAVNLPDGVIANFGSQTRVSVIVSASRDAWRSIASDAVSATVDLAQRGEGTYDLPVSVVSKNPDLKIIAIKPDRVSVTVEPLIKKTIGIVAKFSGKANDDLVPDEPTFTPEKVELTGPKSSVDDINQGIVEVKLDGLKDPINQKFTVVALTSDGEEISNVKFNPTEVTAKINLVKAGKLKTVGIKPKINGQPSSGNWIQSITTDPLTVTLTGAVDALDKLTFAETEPVSVTGLSTTTTLTTTLSLPSGITIADSTTKIKVTFTIGPSDTTKSINPQIVYSGLSTSLKITVVNPGTITAIVSGPTSVLNNLDGTTVKLTLDLSVYASAGVYKVSFKNSDFSLPSGVSLVSFLPSIIDITLENK